MSTKIENGNLTATGIIRYQEDGEMKDWRIVCMAWETESHLRNHLKTFKPKAKFISGKIIPDQIETKETKT
jgi:hypothetical protein